jgi:hypothetical protein
MRVYHVPDVARGSPSACPSEFSARKNVAVGLADHVMVESFNQLKNGGYKIYEAAREIANKAVVAAAAE